LEWYLALLFIVGSFIVLMLTGMPVAFCFMLVNIIGVLLWWGGIPALERLIISIFDSVTIFTLLPVPLFILMGVVTLHSGIAPILMDTLDKWLGRLPGRLGLLSVAAGTLFSTLTGEPVASVAMLGSTLVPDMERRGYKKPMSIGPILGSSGIAMMIPPSSLAVFFGAIGLISIGKILMGIIIPGLMLGVLLAGYIIIRCKLQPSIAPPYEVPPTSISEKLIATVRYVLPVGLVIFLVIGVIFLGVATPSESAASGVLGIFILAALYRRLNWEMVKKSFSGTIEIVVMVFMIIAAAKAFGQNLAFTGATKGLAEFTVGLPLAPIIIFIAIQVIVVIMGMFMEPASIIMITLPVFMPVVYTLGFDPVWFAVVTLLNIQLGMLSPPFGMSLFVMKGVAPPDTTMGDIYRAALPFFALNLVGMALIIAFPAMALWLPGLMR